MNTYEHGTDSMYSEFNLRILIHADSKQLLIQNELLASPWRNRQLACKVLYYW